MTVTLPIFEPRPYQLPVLRALDEGYKRVIFLAHRRSGKDITALNYMIKKMWEEVGVYFYILPNYAQGRKVIWDSITSEGKKIISYFPEPLIEKKNESEMKIRLHNGSLFQLVGSDSYDSLMGTNPRGVVFSEQSLQDPMAWEYIKPILRANQGWALFVTTPRGKNHFYELWGHANRNPKTWFVHKVTVEDSKALTPEEIEEAHNECNSEEMFQQEYMCSFDVGIEGTYYGRLVDKLRKDGRLMSVKYDTAVNVDTYWDLGYGDSTSIIFAQRVGSAIHVIDYYENSGEGLQHYVKMLQDKPYVYGKHWAPHDVEAGDLSTGQSLRHYAQGLGLAFNVVKKTKIDYGIECGRALFSNAYIDEGKCEHLIKCLENYHKSYNDKMRVYSSTPVHDEWSHGCFVSGTKISTPSGDKNIEDVIIGDKVLTPNGSRKVLNTFVYDANQTHSISTTTTSIECTPNHNIFSNCGLIHADTLVYNDAIYSQGDDICNIIGYHGKESLLGFRDYFSSMKMKDCCISTGIDMFGMGTIIERLIKKVRHSLHCKGLYGLTSMGTFLKDIMSTISMGMQRIMRLKTCEQYQQVIIAGCIKHLNEGNNQERISLSQWSTQRNGTLAKKVESGTVSTPFKWGSGILGHWKSLANSVIRSIKQRITFKGFAQINASQSIDTNQESTTKKENVSYVDQTSCVTSMPLKERVTRNVIINYPTTLKVYDLEVEDDHCYYANGLLVSNSDAWRYMAVANRSGSGTGMTPDKLKEMRARQHGNVSPLNRPFEPNNISIIGK